MDKCSEAEMRRNLALVLEFKKAGMDFVVVPVFNAADKLEVIKYAEKRLDMGMAKERNK